MSDHPRMNPPMNPPIGPASDDAGSRPGPSWLRKALLALMGAAVGAALGFVAAPWFRTLGWADALASAVAMALLFGGLVLLVSAAGLLGPRGGAARSLSEVTDARIQSVVLLLAGVMMAVPVALVRFPLAPALLGWAAVVTLFAFQTVGNLVLWVRGDELVRRAIADVGALTFWFGQGVLFLYAAGERLGLFPSLTAFEIVTVMMAVFLIANIIVSIRRGLA